MEYKTGFTVKPYQVTGIGQVVFTDGTTNNIIPNQLQCEAYGYTYDRTLGTCRAFRYTPLLPVNTQNTNNRLNGPGYTTQGGSNTIQMNGTGNTTRGLNNNCSINGRENKIGLNINNATVNGSMGIALRQGEIVLGGGLTNGLTGSKKGGLSQSSKIQLSGLTTNAAAINLTVQEVDGAYIELQTNSILGFEIYVTRLETGGTSGTAGNFNYMQIKGAARCDNGGTIILYIHTNASIASLGLGALTPAIIVDSSTGGIPSISVQVTGLANIDSTWSATAQLHELTTTIAF